MKFKALTAAFAATIMALSTTAVASADNALNGVNTMPATSTIQSDDLAAHERVQIGEYDCWVENGQYYTVEDGEVCQVVNLDELEWTHDKSKAASDWLNGPVVDISDGHTYNGNVDITTNDDSTPIFIGYTKNTTKQKISYNLKAGFIFSNSYRVGVHGYNPIYESWDYSEVNITFSAIGQHKILFSGTTGVAPTKMCLTFIKDYSTGEKNIGYSFYVV